MGHLPGNGFAQRQRGVVRMPEPLGDNASPESENRRTIDLELRHDGCPSRRRRCSERCPKSVEFADQAIPKEIFELISRAIVERIAFAGANERTVEHLRTRHK